MTAEAFPRLHFQYGFDDDFASEVRSRGWLDGVTVELASGIFVPVCFYDPVRLVQDLTEETKLGRPYIAERNMIILNEITLDGIQGAVKRLVREGFFGQAN